MAIITISRGCCSRGREVAEEVAKRLGYACISREILLDASEIFHASELKLHKAIHDAPSVLDRFTNGKERYVTYIEAALLKFLKEDNIVYHGLAGHFFVKNIPHVMKVRIISDMDDRIKIEMERENVSAEEAVKIIRRDDEQRKKWSGYLYGIDNTDPSLYDLVIHIKRLGVDDAADIICRAAKRQTFETSKESAAAIRNTAVAAEVKAMIVNLASETIVSADGDQITINAKAGDLETGLLALEIRKRALSVKGANSVNVSLQHVFEYSE